MVNDDDAVDPNDDAKLIWIDRCDMLGLAPFFIAMSLFGMSSLDCNG